MKKQKGKGGKVDTKKSKEEKPKPTDEQATSTADDKDLAHVEADNQGDNLDTQDEVAKEKADIMGTQLSEPKSETTDRSPHNRQHSLSLQSRMRSSSFRRTSLSQGPLSPSADGAKSPELGAMSPDAESLNIYRKQAARLDELEKENKRLANAGQEAERK